MPGYSIFSSTVTPSYTTCVTSVAARPFATTSGSTLSESTPTCVPSSQSASPTVTSSQSTTTVASTSFAASVEPIPTEPSVRRRPNVGMHAS